MSVSDILYIPWFREAEGKRMPWAILWEYFASKNIAFSRIKLPGDIKNTDEGTLFSMTSVQERVREHLEWLQKNTKVLSYSLSAFPVLEALHSVSDQVRKKVEQVIFLHPAKNPLSAVAMMDWSLGSHSHIFDETYYLEGAKNEVFQTLIGDWRGNAEIFQADLQRYHNLLSGNRRYFDARVFELRDEIHDIKVLESNTDSIVSVKKWFDFQERRSKEKAQFSHIPKLSPEVLESTFS